MTLEDKVDEIYKCLVTNPLNSNDEGLIDKVKRHEKEIQELRKTKSNKWDWGKIFSLGAKIGSKAGGM